MVNSQWSMVKIANYQYAKQSRIEFHQNSLVAYDIQKESSWFYIK
jgi:hypothetical protein